MLLVKFYFKNFKNGYFVFSPYGIMLIFPTQKNDMGTYQLLSIFGIGLSEASLKCTRIFF